MKTWWYQLQKHIRLDIKADVLVMDIDAEPKPYRQEGREVWAYFSIGEAEDYRGYWKNLDKSLLAGPVNPEWEGNYPVKFWSPEWWDLMALRALAAEAKGFTGLYLDKCDVVWDIPELDEKQGMKQMVDLIDYIAGVVPGMKICMQNAEPLLQFEALHEVIDCIAIEDLLYGIPITGSRNDASETAERMEWIELWRGPKLAVEYLDSPGEARKALRELEMMGFVPLIRGANRELD